MLSRYRAWEKTLSEMIAVKNIDFKARMINKGSAWRFFDEIELMEYTGWFDVNGLELCEADIVLNAFGTTGVVRKSEVEGTWEFDTNDGVFSICEKDEFRVIGNTYDNKTLWIELGGV